jgi:integrase
MHRGTAEDEGGRPHGHSARCRGQSLAEHLEGFVEGGPDTLVFEAPEGGFMRRSNFRRRVWVPATRQVEVEGLRFHDLRHTAATLALTAGATPRELMERMGDASSSVAARYQHVMEGRDSAIAAALDDLIRAAAMVAHGKQEHDSEGTRGARRPPRREQGQAG